MGLLDALRQLLARPNAECREYVGATWTDDSGAEVTSFDPWSLFPSLYGSYSASFDDMALEVLCGLERGKYWPSSLAHEMFQEMLCTADLCDYGTSPRACFPTQEFAALLPELIAKWRVYYAMQWGEEAPTRHGGE